MGLNLDREGRDSIGRCRYDCNRVYFGEWLFVRSAKFCHKGGESESVFFVREKRERE